MGIRQDPVSKGLTVIAVAELMFLSTYGADLMLRSLFAALLAIGGLVLMLFTGNLTEDPSIDGMETRSMLTWIVVSLGVIVMLAFSTPRLPLDTGQMTTFELAVVPRMFGVLIAVSEEQFFRGFMTNYFVQRTNFMGGVLLSGVAFGLYHLAVYGTNPALMLYVMGAGIVLSYVALRTGRVSTTMIAHVAVNMFAGG